MQKSKTLQSRQGFSLRSVITYLVILILIFLIQNSGFAQIPAEDDRIGWSADGNKNDPDDWSATPLALAIFAKMGWQEKLVHFDYNNRLDASLEWKEAENYESTIGGAKRFGFNEDIFFDDQRELESAIEHAKEEINNLLAFMVKKRFEITVPDTKSLRNTGDMPRVNICR